MCLGVHTSASVVSSQVLSECLTWHFSLEVAVSGFRGGVLHLWYQSGDRFLVDTLTVSGIALHTSKCIDMSLLLIGSWIHRHMMPRGSRARLILDIR